MDNVMNIELKKNARYLYYLTWDSCCGDEEEVRAMCKEAEDWCDEHDLDASNGNFINSFHALTKLKSGDFLLVNYLEGLSLEKSELVEFFLACKAHRIGIISLYPDDQKVTYHDDSWFEDQDKHKIRDSFADNISDRFDDY